MVKTPLAFEFSKTRMICDAFDEAWALLQGVGSDLTAPSNSLASRTILAKRIIEMADQGLMDVTQLRDDALAFVQHNPSGSQKKAMCRRRGHISLWCSREPSTDAKRRPLALVTRTQQRHKWAKCSGSSC